jgi:hypothetical protein
MRTGTKKTAGAVKRRPLEGSIVVGGFDYAQLEGRLFERRWL